MPLLRSTPRRRRQGALALASGMRLRAAGALCSQGSCGPGAPASPRVARAEWDRRRGEHRRPGCRSAFDRPPFPRPPGASERHSRGRPSVPGRRGRVPAAGGPWGAADPPHRGRMERLRPVGGRLPPFEGDPRGVLGSPGRLHCTGLFRAFFALVTSHALSESEFSSHFVWEQREESPVFPDVNFCRL